MQKYKLVSIEDNIIQVDDFDSLCNIEQYAKNKGLSFSTGTAHPEVLTLALTEHAVYTVMFAGVDKDTIREIMVEIENKLIFIPEERSKNKIYRLVNTINGNVVIDEDNVVFCIDRLSDRYRLNKEFINVKDGLRFDDAMNLHMKNMYEYELNRKETDAHN